MKIEEVAQACGLTKRTIRYYEEIGLIPPPERSEGGIRLYTQAHIDRLNKMLNAREVLGFSLQELQQHIAMRDELEAYRKSPPPGAEAEVREKLTEVDRLLAEHLALTERKMAGIRELQGELRGIRERIRNRLSQLEES
ncbi:MerR family transcriptional regulator [Cohnella nanjingensis]|nr:MerR family transcriptional regulator [Cohnella nanjingensis]